MAPLYGLELPLRALDLVLTQTYVLPIRLIDAMRTKLAAYTALLVASSSINATHPYLIGLGIYRISVHVMNADWIHRHRRYYWVNIPSRASVTAHS
jgi:hypothetical protein